MSKLQQTRANCWSVTINNPTSTDEYNIQSARQKGWKVEGQLEKAPTTGTLHYQLMVKTPQVRMSAVTGQFPRAHVEPARNKQALEVYVNKEETREGKLIEQSEMYPSLAKLWDMFTEYHDAKYLHGDPTEMGGVYPKREFHHPDKRLEVFDEFIADAIRRGYHVETMGVNPQMRACIKNYFYAILHRSRINIRRQTDRQTAEIPALTDEYNNEGTEEVSTSSSSVSSEGTSSAFAKSNEA